MLRFRVSDLMQRPRLVQVTVKISAAAVDLTKLGETPTAWKKLKYGPWDLLPRNLMIGEMSRDFSQSLSSKFQKIFIGVFIYLFHKKY